MKRPTGGKMKVWLVERELSVALGRIVKRNGKEVVEFESKYNVYACLTNEEIVERIKHFAVRHGLDKFVAVETKVDAEGDVVDRYVNEDNILKENKRVWQVVVCV